MVALPPDEPGGHIFKTILLHCLPGDLKDLVAVQFHQLKVASQVCQEDGGGCRTAGHIGGGVHPG